MAKFETEIKDPQKPAEEVFNPLDEPVNEKRYTQPNVNKGNRNGFKAGCGFNYAGL